jgi:hypothetical protein
MAVRGMRQAKVAEIYAGRRDARCETTLTAEFTDGCR